MEMTNGERERKKEGRESNVFNVCRNRVEYLTNQLYTCDFCTV